MWYFTTALMNKYGNSGDKGMTVIGSQVWVMVRYRFDWKSRLRKWLIGIELYELDYIIWPFHMGDYAHWCLVIINVLETLVYFFDPYHPEELRVDNVKKCNYWNINSIFLLFWQKNICYNSSWKFKSGQNISDYSQFTMEPTGNRAECRSFVCACILAFFRSFMAGIGQEGMLFNKHTLSKAEYCAYNFVWKFMFRRERRFWSCIWRKAFRFHSWNKWELTFIAWLWNWIVSIIP